MRQMNYAALQEPYRGNDLWNPLHITNVIGGHPHINFFWKEVNGKRRLIGNPNRPMRILHKLFGQFFLKWVKAMGKDDYTLRRLPSSTGFVKGSNPLKNAQKHIEGKFFYVVDIWNAYPSINLGKLSALLVYIGKYGEYRLDFSLSMLGQDNSLLDILREDPLFLPMKAFLASFFSGLRGEGLAVGGPLSPFFFNLYCEVFVDAGLRKLCERDEITFTRYADDLVFSRSKPITGTLRREIRRTIIGSGLKVNHRKSKVLSRRMGTVFVTKIGLRENPAAEEGASLPAILVFPKKKRKRLHGIIGSYLHKQMDWPEKVSGFIAEFLYYYKNVGKPTATDRKTFALCKEFEAEWAKYKQHRKHR